MIDVYTFHMPYITEAPLLYLTHLGYVNLHTKKKKKNWVKENILPGWA